MNAHSYVLDASALLAYAQDETGAEAAEEVLAEGAVISAVNWAEVLTRLGESRDEDPAALEAYLSQRGLVRGLLTVVPFTESESIVAAQLRAVARRLGLSLADRACLATGIRLGATVLTADRAWSGLSVGIAINVIR
jgi:ribonuclease VapC